MFCDSTQEHMLREGTVQLMDVWLRTNRPVLVLAQHRFKESKRKQRTEVSAGSETEDSSEDSDGQLAHSDAHAAWCQRSAAWQC